MMVGTFRLCHLVLVMRELQILAAAVDIDDRRIEFLADHDDTLGMPARTSFTPRRIPLDAFLCLLPQRKILRILLEIVGLDSGTRIEIFQFLM